MTMNDVIVKVLRDSYKTEVHYGRKTLQSTAVTYLMCYSGAFLIFHHLKYIHFFSLISFLVQILDPAVFFNCRGSWSIVIYIYSYDYEWI